MPLCWSVRDAVCSYLDNALSLGPAGVGMYAAVTSVCNLCAPPHCGSAGRWARKRFLIVIGELNAALDAR